MDEHQAAVTPNWTALSVVAATGVALGLLPYLLYLRRPWLALVLAACAAIVVPLKARGFVCRATEQPGPLEWLLAGWNAVAYGATASLVGFVWYAITWQVVWTVGVAANLLDIPLDVVPSTSALYVSAFFVGLFGLAMPFLIADELPAKLYPGVAGTRSVFFPLTTRPRLLALAAFGIAAVVVAGAALLERSGVAFTLLLCVLFVFSGAPLVRLGSRERRSGPMAESLAALRRLFAAAGYRLTDAPRTGSPEVDPLIAAIDLLAIGAGRAYAVKAKLLPSRDDGADWTPAFEVRAGAKALQRVLRESGEAALVVRPYLLVIGGRVDAELKAFAAGEGVELVHLDDLDALGSALAAAQGDDALRELAFGRFGLLPATSDAAAGRPAAGVTR